MRLEKLYETKTAQMTQTILQNKNYKSENRNKNIYLIYF